MNSIKKITVLIIAVIGFFTYSKAGNDNTPKSKVILEEVNVVELLSKQEQGCRPSSEVMFYVDTEIVKKHRGFSEINAKIYVLDRITGKTNLLTSENILLAYYQDSVLGNALNTCDSSLNELKNGDKLIGDNIVSTYSFSELMKYETIYDSYIRSTNKLLNIKRI
ncbi:hypothetical protein BW723_10660 [Polaribacter reichenbachii]|uniref:Uncharacterized protein n=1 Tax=Polaribacter reichenbachii TaxID=996801 RepID=A0A1B8TQD3_9FLAO|nr:hypothetical protein [Polaribacter reichenbachii]APZ46717.1 hypothetical protein BW723_10660 [Polaribacter reichenbachii]AUC17360.1 hypothetical protein BTO17_01105 [Polaribacter reichenbachii]OBY61764.1 hypothetical protein LPB301_17095 [Polaribacter reichenbachii]